VSTYRAGCRRLKASTLLLVLVVFLGGASSGCSGAGSGLGDLGGHGCGLGVLGGGCGCGHCDGGGGDHKEIGGDGSSWSVSIGRLLSMLLLLLLMMMMMRKAVKPIILAALYFGA